MTSPTADEIYARAQRAKANFDERMHNVKQQGRSDYGGDLVGTADSLKSRESFDAKEARAVDAGVELYDLNRYTFIFPREQYSAGVQEKYDQLRAAGFAPIENAHRDDWHNASYKGLNTNWRDNDPDSPHFGQPVEVQFHTLDSFQAAKDTHDLYALRQDRPGERTEPRDYVESEYQDAVDQLQAERFQSVQPPDDLESLHRQEPYIRKAPRPVRPAPEKMKETVRRDEQALRERETRQRAGAESSGIPSQRGQSPSAALDRQVDRSSQAGDGANSASSEPAHDPDRSKGAQR